MNRQKPNEEAELPVAQKPEAETRFRESEPPNQQGPMWTSRDQCGVMWTSRDQWGPVGLKGTNLIQSDLLELNSRSESLDAVEWFWVTGSKTRTSHSDEGLTVACRITAGESPSQHTLTLDL